jgi:hypothetical protein
MLLRMPTLPSLQSCKKAGALPNLSQDTMGFGTLPIWTNTSRRRNMKSNDTRKKLSLHSIVIQSPLIKEVLGEVFGGYAGVTTTLERLEFNAPFKPFVHRWAKFREARDAETNPETKIHLDLLWNTLYTELKTTLEACDDMIAKGVMTYELLWTMFEAGTLVFYQDGE